MSERNHEQEVYSLQQEVIRLDQRDHPYGSAIYWIVMGLLCIARQLAIMNNREDRRDEVKKQ